MGFSSLVLLVFILSSVSLSTSNPVPETFLQCLLENSTISSEISKIVYSPHNSSYTDILQSSIFNLRFMNTTTKPQFIITPEHESHIQAAVVCSRKLGLRVRVLSGGHDYEGLSYTSNQPFVIIDLINLQNISIDIAEKTAWVQAGATLGEVYYRIGEASNTLAFSAGTCHTLGVGGHFSGGGLGALMRKYGVAADNILDAYIVDANGRLLDRKSMGEDLFWAIRGGGGASFGVIVSWKIRLVPVPETVTIFAPLRTLEQGATALVTRWQEIADKFPQDLFVRLFIQVKTIEEKKTIQVRFQSSFLGKIDQLLPLMEKSFPELGLEAKDCTEMSWVNSTVFFADFPIGQPLDVLRNRTHAAKFFFKSRSDFVKKPIPSTDLEGILEVLLQVERPVMVWEPWGGKMGEIPESETPFPHRAGNVLGIQYFTQWPEEGASASKKFMELSRRL